MPVWEKLEMVVRVVPGSTGLQKRREVCEKFAPAGSKDALVILIPTEIDHLSDRACRARCQIHSEVVGPGAFRQRNPAGIGIVERDRICWERLPMRSVIIVHILQPPPPFPLGDHRTY